MTAYQSLDALNVDYTVANEIADVDEFCCDPDTALPSYVLAYAHDWQVSHLSRRPHHYADGTTDNDLPF